MRNVGAALVEMVFAIYCSRLLLSKQSFSSNVTWIHRGYVHRKLSTGRLGGPHEAYRRFEWGSPAAGYRGRGAASNAGPRDPQAAEQCPAVL